MAISSFHIHKLEFPVGRVIGDNGCAYSHLHLVVVRLRDRSGLEGWGSWHGASRGRNHRPAEWFQDLASEAELTGDFEQAVLPVLFGREAGELLRTEPSFSPKQSLLDMTVREALWDLAAKSRGLPLWRHLGGTRDRVPAYGSLLDFPLDDAEACDLARRMVARGFRTLKIKVGGTLERDVRRLRAIRAAVGPHIELTGDANQAWTVETAVVALATFAAERVPLGYIEDPLPPGDAAAFGELARRSGVPIAAHDYVLDASELEPLIATRGVQKLRSRRSPDYAIAVHELAVRHDLTVTMTNSLFETATHAAVALPRFERIEFSDIGWNEFAPHPICYEGGQALAPECLGLGQEMKPDDLERFHVPGASTWRA
jgi:L-alanine-DL-glutamate epimerase-like enolase superfamily enzyme